ncbi:MAG TPA: type IV pilus biogenesis/stability protein PilW [Gammaproteobacteria bacterium]|nr:type IV pilus biogenesis/stability protein PilW [Gammaproteobacteria bacterium]
MKILKANGFWLSVAMLLLAGCVSTSSTPENKISLKQASQDNVSLGVAYLQQGRRDLAMQKLQLALQQDPDNANAFSALGLLYNSSSDFERADKNYREALNKAPDDPQIQNNYAVFLCQQGKPKESEKYFIEAAQNPLYPTPEAAYANAGVCANLIPDRAMAEQYFRKSLAINPDYPLALYQMARLSYDQKQYRDALIFIQRFESASPAPRPEVLLLGVHTENALGNKQGAEGYSKKLRILFPNSPETQQLNQSYNNAGNPG